MALTSSEHWLTFSSELTFFPFGKVNAFCASHSAKISKMMTDSVSEPHTSSQQLHFPRLTIKLMVFHFVSNEIWKQWFVYHVIWRWISLYNSFIWTVYEAGARVRNFILAFHGFQFRILSPCVQCSILVCLSFNQPPKSLGVSFVLFVRSYGFAVLFFIPFVIERGNFMVIITVVACHYYSVCSQKVKFNSLFISKFLRSHFLGSTARALADWLTDWFSFFAVGFGFVFIPFWITERCLSRWLFSSFR